MTHSLPLLAETVMRTTFEWGRIQSNSDWVLPVTVSLAIMIFVRWLYRRDARELGPWLGWLLTALRTATFYGLLFLYLEPQWRNEREETRNSKVVLLADTSLSMSLPAADAGSSAGSTTRAQQVAALLENSDLVTQLRKTHDVVLARFDQELVRIATLAKRAAAPPAEPAAAPPPEAANPPTGPPAEAPSVDWHKVLTPAGAETRIGQALQQLSQDEQSGTTAGIVVFTDGGQNAGVAPEIGIQAAKEAKIPVFPVGLGSRQRPAQVRISDLAAPPRAYPGDRYTVTGYLQAQGLAGQTATVELTSRDAGSRAATPDAARVEGTQQVTFGVDGEVVPVKFELQPDKTGRRTLTLRVRAPGADRNAGEAQREADVEIVDHKTRVLLLAGGPQREYQFLRNLLFRDQSMKVDVLLQTAQPGISQEANAILEKFPDSRETLFAYDCIVALDPDWQQLGAAAIDLLEKWVAEQAGGLIVVAGPVNAGKTISGWIQDPAMNKVRALYPVEFQRSLAMVENDTYQSGEPARLEFTREGLDAEYLWLDDTAVASQEAWGEFPGVFAFQPVRGPKPGASVLARFNDAHVAQGGKTPPYFVVQYYGSGRVFYLGSGEMWRLRGVDEAYFEKFYTKLIRHVSQGRLLRGSARGVLLVGQDRGYLVGGTVDVRAQLSNAQLEPLVADHVEMHVVGPDGKAQPLQLKPDPTRAGTFAGHFPALLEGTYRLELPIPESNDPPLARHVQVELPRSELKEPQRNDELLAQLARQTGGHYYIGTDALAASAAPDALLNLLKDRSRTVILTAAPDLHWERTWLQGMMLGLCTLLCLEWLIRRLAKLA